MLLPNPETMPVTLSRLFQPPILSQANRPAITVEIINATGNEEMALLAADNLAWYGFVPIVSDTTRPRQSETTIRYYAENFKASYDWLISQLMGYPMSAIELVTDTPYDTNYQITLGTDYDPCISQFYTGE
ncbi:MAG: LytR C-terminal domain-containing protein [Chloroflexi bacterium]|nr:LytR C-terminal domain-containing protein [Chloroflexota bacterium]